MGSWSAGIRSGNRTKDIGSFALILKANEVGIREDQILALFPPHAASRLNFPVVEDCR